MKSLVITLRITDPETVENYRDVDKYLVMDDLRFGTLTDKCEMVEMKEEE